MSIPKSSAFIYSYSFFSCVEDYTLTSDGFSYYLFYTPCSDSPKEGEGFAKLIRPFARSSSFFDFSYLSRSLKISISSEMVFSKYLVRYLWASSSTCRRCIASWRALQSCRRVWRAATGVYSSLKYKTI